MTKRFLILFVLMAGALAGVEPTIDYAALAEAAFRGTVKRAETRDRQLGSIELFRAALFFCRGARHLDSLDVLFDVAAEMQDRREGSRGCGNFRWNWRDGFVMDYNAVDFCMEAGSLLARDWMPVLTPEQRAKFQTLLDWSIRGCLQHRVRDSYTNIAIMNAANLILLGEACARPEVFAEGVRRLDAFLLTTALNGVCEYASPTYTGVDLANLHRLHAFVRDADTKAKAAKLLRLFWTDLAASSFAGAGRLVGPNSRTYDYPYGMGAVADYLRYAELVPVGNGRLANLTDYAADSWRIDEPIRQVARTAPRLVESFWGEEETKYRVVWTGRHIALGVAGENYWNMDMPLAVDFEATNCLVRGYFIADGRRDPFGRKKIPEGSGPHQKTLHLRPFWAGVQRTREALGLVLYRPDDIPPQSPTLESHFVLPSDVDEIWIDGERVALDAKKPFVRELEPMATLAVRKGAGGCGVRVVWARAIAGKPARMALVYDPQAGVPAFRLTVAHHDAWGAEGDSLALPRPGAAFWVRVCDEADDPAKWAAFRQAFRVARAAVAEKKAKLQLKLAGEEGALEIAAVERPGVALLQAAPVPQRAVLVVNGKDLGREILGEVPGLAAARAEMARMKQEMEKNRIVVSSRRETVWEAETGVVKPLMRVDKDELAYGEEYVWVPGAPGARGIARGSVSWQLEVAEAGTYHLWGRVWAPTPDDDSFNVKVTAGPFARHGLAGRTILPLATWSTGLTQGVWKWRPFATELTLPKGPAVLTLGAREDGTKIDRLLLTSEAEPMLK